MAYRPYIDSLSVMANEPDMLAKHECGKFTQIRVFPAEVGVSPIEIDCEISIII